MKKTWLEPQQERLREMINEGRSVADAMKEFGLSSSAIIGAADRHKLGNFKRQNGPYLKQPPKDFADRYAELAFNDLVAHYRNGRVVIRRWITDLGLNRADYPLPRQARAAAAVFGGATGPRYLPRSRLQGGGVATGWKRTLDKDPYVRDDSAAGRAADYLQILDQVFRCDAKGKFDPTGDYHMINNRTLMDHEQIVAYAEERKARKERLARMAA